jgi:ribonuclease Z
VSPFSFFTRAKREGREEEREGREYEPVSCSTAFIQNLFASFAFFALFALRIFQVRSIANLFQELHAEEGTSTGRLSFAAEVQLLHSFIKVSTLFEIVFLGTSASAPSAKRGLAAQVVKRDEFRFLIDCGEGTQRQILQSGIGFKHLENILITHGHLDHILGLAGLLSTFMRWEAIGELNIYGGRWALDRIKDLLYGVVLRGAQSPMPINLREIKPGVFFEADGFSVSAFPVYHRGSDSLGFRFEERAHRPFLPEKAEELGVPAGPVRRELVDGKTIKLADGRKVGPEDVLGPLRPGIRLVHIGDAGRTEDLVAFCEGADALVIESTYLEEEAEMAKQFSHLTAKQAAGLATQAGVRQLILTHISRRYRQKDVLAEARSVFPEVHVARDFDVFQVKPG